jgi:predicted AlkP superfamily phosphohydrolase/phosphomutase
MHPPVIAIGLDAADPDLYNKLIDAGHLKNLRRLRDRGCYVPLTSVDYGAAEAGWTVVLSGVNPEKTGFWTLLKYNRDDYDVKNCGAYDYDEYPMFYELGNEFKVAAIDIPQARLSKSINGIQVLGYGSHSQQGLRESNPENLLGDLIERYGDHPVYDNDEALLWNRAKLEALTDGLKTGATRRGQICRDLLRNEEWNLFFTIFGETHSGGHFLRHMSQPDHPFNEVYDDLMGSDRDPLLEVLEAVDEAMGEIIDAAPEDSTFVVFSQEGMVPNNLDLTSLVFLSELMYRMNFPGTFGLSGGPAGDNSPPPPMITKPHSLGWARAVLSLKHDDNVLRRALRRHFPIEVSYGLDRLLGDHRCPRYPGTPFGQKAVPHWMGPIWYRDEWRNMKAFALPSFDDGYVRVNLKGRDKHGVVDPAEYDAICDELASEIRQLRNARTGQAIARQVIRTRKSNPDSDTKLPDADLVVKWVDEPADVVDSPNWGRIGPVPHRRSGGHNSKCFAVISGPGIKQESSLPTGRAVDIPPTILKLLNAPIPDWFDGHPLELSEAAGVT